MIKPLLKKSVPIPLINKNSAFKRTKDFVVTCSEESFYLYDSDGVEILTFQVNQLEYCCGMEEIGNIFLYDTLTDKEKVTVDQFLDNYFAYLLGRNTEKNKKGEYKKAYIVNLVPVVDGGCRLLRESFIRTGYFTLVKSFNNKNSENLIEVWISNN